MLPHKPFASLLLVLLASAPAVACAAHDHLGVLGQAPHQPATEQTTIIPVTVRSKWLTADHAGCEEVTSSQV